VIQKCLEFLEETCLCPLHITDNEILFFFLAKDDRTRKSVKAALEAYRELYKAFFDVKSHLDRDIPV
jgi:hypothetical protein